MFIIDFDNTLFNTHTDQGSFVDMRYKDLAQLGVSEEIYHKTGKQIQTSTSKGQGLYTSERHAEAIAQYGFDKQEIFDALHKTMFDMRSFLFPDTEDFLQSLKNTGKPLVLFSFGDPEWQYEKVKGCGIEKYFDRVFMTKQPKQEVIHKLLEHVHNQEVWFINDRVQETQEVIDVFPQIKAILKISVNNNIEDYENSGLPYFKTLTEIKNYIYENKKS